MAKYCQITDEYIAGLKKKIEEIKATRHTDGTYRAASVNLLIGYIEALIELGDDCIDADKIRIRTKSYCGPCWKLDLSGTAKKCSNNFDSD